MPNRSNLPPVTINPARPKPSPTDAARRLALLDTTVLRWLRDAGWPKTDAAAQLQMLAPMIGQWLIEKHPEQLFDRMPALTDRLIRQLPPTRLPATDAFISAFAGSLITHAIDDVAREAQRAGHAHVFAGLRSYLLVEPGPATLAELGAALQLSQAALAIALSRLRHRLRQRIESGLALWATSPESRQTLRQQLRQSLIGTESTP
jgi:hypothetical protein